jgi:hypothetical protein
VRNRPSISRAVGLVGCTSAAGSRAGRSSAAHAKNGLTQPVQAAMICTGHLLGSMPRNALSKQYRRAAGSHTECSQAATRSGEQATTTVGRGRGVSSGREGERAGIGGASGHCSGRRGIVGLDGRGRCVRVWGWDLPGNAASQPHAKEGQDPRHCYCSLCACVGVVDGARAGGRSGRIMLSDGLSGRLPVSAMATRVSPCGDAVHRARHGTRTHQSGATPRTPVSRRAPPRAARGPEVHPHASSLLFHQNPGACQVASSNHGFTKS